MALLNLLAVPSVIAGMLLFAGAVRNVIRPTW